MYSIKTIKNRNEIEQCELFQINQYMWNSKQEPKAYGWMGYIEGEGLYAKMVCEERNPRRVYQNHKESVWMDSTMEVFLAFTKDGEELTNDCMYTNFEMNSNGAMYANFGCGRKNRQFITDEQYEQAGCRATIEEDRWSVEVLFPENYLKEICDWDKMKNGKVFYCNFYKIAEAEDIQHFGSYSSIDLPKPNFHVPVFFSEAMIKSER